MTGDAICGVKFPRAWRGYDPGQVDRLVRNMGRLLDAGMPPPATPPRPGEFAKVMRGYDCQAVDRFFAALASDRAQQVPAPGPASPWEPGYEEPEPPEGSATGDRRAEWRGVAYLPGTRLRRTWGPTSKIIDSDGQVLLTHRGRTLRVAASGQVFRKDNNRAEIVDVATGALVLCWIGSHSYYHAGTVVLLPGQHWLRFPIQGSRGFNAVMRAVDESGAEVVWFRMTKRAVVEAVVSPDCGISPEILCVIELAAWWLVVYFTPPIPGG
jgi:DivIVA domain-containing protein